MSFQILSTVYAVNGNGDFESCKPLPDPTQSEKKSLNKEILEAVIDTLPEMRKLEEVLDNYYYNLHDDKKLDRFSNLFSHLLVDNPSIFSMLDSAQKAQVLFDKYNDLVLTELLKTEDYQTHHQSLQSKIVEWTRDESLNPEIAEKICKNFKSQIIQLHSNFLTVAIANSLGVKPSSLHFSSVQKSVDLDVSNIDFSLLKNSCL